MTKDVCLSYQEYSVLFARIEAMMNSRPLCYKGDGNGENSEIITPGHFLIGRSMLENPQFEDDNLDGIDTLKRLEHVRNRLKALWKVWSLDYLNMMQRRTKWKLSNPSIKVGQLVFVKSEGVKPFQWPVGVVEKIRPGPDGHVELLM